MWAEPALLVSVYEQLYELVAALPTENDGGALNSAIDYRLNAACLQWSKINTTIICVSDKPASKTLL